MKNALELAKETPEARALLGDEAVSALADAVWLAKAEEGAALLKQALDDLFAVAYETGRRAPQAREEANP